MMPTIGITSRKSFTFSRAGTFCMAYSGAADGSRSSGPDQHAVHERQHEAGDHAGDQQIGHVGSPSVASSTVSAEAG